MPLEDFRKFKIGINACLLVQLTGFGPKKPNSNPSPPTSVPLARNQPVILWSPGTSILPIFEDSRQGLSNTFYHHIGWHQEVIIITGGAVDDSQRLVPVVNCVTRNFSALFCDVPDRHRDDPALRKAPGAVHQECVDIHPWWGPAQNAITVYHLVDGFDFYESGLGWPCRCNTGQCQHHCHTFDYSLHEWELKFQVAGQQNFSSFVSGAATFLSVIFFWYQESKSETERCAIPILCALDWMCVNSFSFL